MLDETSGHGVALLFLDLDDFKTVNDTLGHGVGDELLVQVADRIRHSIRPGDIPTRLGGDEFGVLVADVDVGRRGEIADRLVDALRAPLRSRGPRDLRARLGRDRAGRAGIERRRADPQRRRRDVQRQGNRQGQPRRLHRGDARARRRRSSSALPSIGRSIART